MKKISLLEKKLNVSAFAFVVAMAATSYSHAHGAHHHGNGTYVGLDAVYNWMGFKQDYGQNIFKKQAPGLNVFVGHMFHQNFGAELGFEWDKKVKKDVTIGANNIILGQNNGTGQSLSFRTKVKQSHPYLGLVAKTSIIGDHCFVSLMLGASLSNMKLEAVNYAIGNAVANSIKTFSKTKLIPVVKVSFEHKFTHQVGMRVLAAWKNTSQFKLKAKENSASEAKLKDAFSVGLGVMYYI